MDFDYIPSLPIRILENQSQHTSMLMVAFRTVAPAHILCLIFRLSLH